MEWMQSIGGFFYDWAMAFWGTLCETGPFLILGVTLAGVLHVVVPPRIVMWALGKKGFSGAFRGALLGMPLPLCSCSVMPTAMALRRQGASLSSVAAFSISTPETSLDAIAITAALLPAAFLGIRPLAGIILAIIVGLVVEAVASSTRDQIKQDVLEFSKMKMDGVSDHAHAEAVICKVCGLRQHHGKEHSHSVFSKARAIFGYAFGNFFEDIAHWVFIGLAVAAFLQTVVPEQFFSQGLLGKSVLLQIILAVIVGIPLYTCATATTPLVAVLMSKGLDPGAALALLLSGPATNFATFLAYYREFGKRFAVAYYTSLFVVCIGLGLLLSVLWPVLATYPSLVNVDEQSAIKGLVLGIPSWLEVGSALVLIALFVRLRVPFLNKTPHQHGAADDCCEPSGHDHDHDGGHDHTHAG